MPDAYPLAAMGTHSPDAVKRLVDRFDQDRKVFQSGDYKEEQLRAKFLNGPFLTIRLRISSFELPLALSSPRSAGTWTTKR
jgi:hypothetical protein